MPEFYDPFKKYGLKRVINCATSLTTLGGSIPDPSIFTAMADAAKGFSSIVELQNWAGRKIAEATGAEAGFPTASACNGLTLAAAACIMRGTALENYDPSSRGRGGWSHLSMKLPLYTEGLKTQFIVENTSHGGYAHSVECAGGRFVKIKSTKTALRDAYDPDRTAGIYFTARSAPKGLSLVEVLTVSQDLDVPVMVDAAAELPPRRKLKYYTGLGADLVIYSGGKHLAALNNTGLLAGKANLIKLAQLQAYPYSGIGRGAKLSREMIVGLVKALEIYLAHDEEHAYNTWLKKAEWFVEQLGGIPGVSAGVTYQRVVEDGEPMAPFTYLELDKSVCGLDGPELIAKLRASDPPIMALWEPAFLLGTDYKGKMCINPEYMLPGEEQIVLTKIKEYLGAS